MYEEVVKIIEKSLKECDDIEDCRACDYYKKSFTECRAMTIAKALCDAGYVKERNKIIFVEDGSVDIDDLSGMGVSVIIYRKGSEKPYLIEV